MLDSTLDLILERHRDLLKRGAVLVDPQGQCDDVRVLFYLEQKIQDGRVHPNGARWIVSQQMQFLEIDEDNRVRQPGYAPYLDYRPITDEERPLVTTVLEAEWLSGSPESQIIGYAVEHLIPEHLNEVKAHKEELVQKTLGAVKDRLTKEINYWDHRAHQLRQDEEAGRRNARINAALARQRADDLTARLERRMEELERERQISPLPPVVIGGALVVPQALLDRLRGETGVSVEISDRERIDRLAVAAVIEAERGLGREPREMPHENPGYDIESKDPRDNRLLFIEVKGKAVGSTTLTASKTQILTALNKPDSFILAIVQVDGDTASEPRYVRQPFEKEPDFAATSVNYELSELLARSEPPN